MRVLVGLDLGGATWTAGEALPLGGAGVGQATWGPAELLRDLELRLGLTRASEPQVVRVACWQARIASVTAQGRYYSKSFEVDPLGTAEALLRLRDALVEAGWRGQPIDGGGRRLEALHELEQGRVAPLPPGTADRLAVVCDTLAAAPRALYDELWLAEPIELWPSRWQSVFRSLERAGTALARFRSSLPGAPADSDLGALQAALRGGSVSVVSSIRGDGSLVHLRAATNWEAACATAAVSARLGSSAVIIREGDPAALDGALQAHGLRTQGLASSVPWRSALQVLPLALELSFEPKDPHHLLELLTLPVGPFSGRVGHELARVLADAPGIGGPRWQAAKAELDGPEDSEAKPARARLLAMVHEWLEAPGADPVQGAPKAQLLAVVARVREWALARIAVAPGDVTLLIAAQHCRALAAAIDSDPRPTSSQVEVRKLVASVASAGGAVELVTERAGRLEHVARAAGLWAPCPVVIWWAFNDHGATPSRPSWRDAELAALRRAGLVFPDPRARLAEHAAAARRAIACATERVILVSASTAFGVPLGNHPLWDEIVARAGLDEASLARLTFSTQNLLDPAHESSALLSPPLVTRPRLDLPGGQTEWSPHTAIAPLEILSFASLDALLSCPLRWVLRYRAGTYSGGHALPSLLQLSGALGHRLIELLHHEDAFGHHEEASGKTEAELRERARAILRELYEREAALLLRPGMAFERSQLERQLVNAAVELSRALRVAGLRIVSVEHPLKATHGSFKLEGRVDLVLAHTDGARAIIDMKWGIARYRDQLKSGQALQLALYGFALATEHGSADLPDAAYFSLKQGKLFALPSALLGGAEIVPGPTLADTWRRAERALQRATETIRAQRLPVTGLRRSLPLLSALGVPEAEHAAHFAHTTDAACQYCGFDALCGRRWEALS